MSRHLDLLARAGRPRRARAPGVLERGGDDPDQVGERRIAAAPAAAPSSLAQEAVGVVVGGGDDRGRVGRAWSGRARARPSGRGPARPASWAISANVRSSARKSGKRSVESASSTTPSVTSGKSWPLATICVPSSSPVGRGVEAREQLGHGVLVGRGVGVQPEDRDVERVAQLGLDALGARAVAGDGQRAAGVAARRDALAVAAVVAGERVLGAVQDERDVAVRALPRLPAGPCRRGSSTSRAG